MTAVEAARNVECVRTVTVCIPTHNRRNELISVLGMLQAQSYQDFDLVICDDGSTDGTHEWLESLGWPHLTVLRNVPNLNYPGTMARLFAAARSKYIAVLHDHDRVDRTWLEQMVRLMDECPSAGLGCCACRLQWPDGVLMEEGSVGLFRLFGEARLLSGRDLVKALGMRVHTPLAAAGSIFRRSVVEQAGGYRTEWYLAADEDLYRRVAARADVAFCPTRLLTLSARPAETAQKLGGWRSIYTLYEFRRDTALRYSSANAAARLWFALRLDVMKATALAREAVCLWMRGRAETLADALRTDLVPPLPTGRPPLGRLFRPGFAGLIALLRRTPALARRADHVRSRYRSAASGAGR